MAYQDMGGGFMSGEQQQSSQQQNKASKHDKQALRAVTIKQLDDAVQDYADGPFQVDGRELSQVTIVAEVKSIVEESTNWTIQLDDGTGTIEAKHWIDNDEPASAAERRTGWAPGKYVRVFGQLRAHQGKRNMVAFQIRVIDDFNEITYHFLEAVHTHVSINKAGMGMSASQSVGVAVKTDGMAVNVSGGLDAQILAMFDTLTVPETGLSLTEMSKHLQNRYSIDQIRSMVERLSDDGQMYSTTDEEHFAKS